MTTKVDSPTFRFDGLKWALIVALIAVAVVGNAYYSDTPVLYRTLGVLVVCSAAVAIAWFTEKGSALWNLVKASRTEMRKVVWPSKPEANQTTLLVLGVVFIAALILTLIDSALGWLTSLIIQ